MKSMKKMLLVALVGALLALTVGVMSACAPAVNNEELIRANLEETLNSVKNMDEETVETLVETMEDNAGDQLATMESMGISMRDIIDAVLDGFDYNIGDITVTGDNAVASVEITSRDVSEFYTGAGQLASELMTSVQTNPEQFAGMTRDEILTYVGDQVKEILDTLPLTENDLDLSYEKEDGEWEMTKASKTQLSMAFFN